MTRSSSRGQGRGLFSPRPYRRREVLIAASEARRKGKKSKAIAEYEKVIAHDGEDPMVLHKLGICLSEANRRGDALDRFTSAARLYKAAGFVDKALAVYVTAAQVVPDHAALWERIASVHVAEGRNAEAIKILMDARRHFKRQRAGQVRLLSRVRTIEEWHFAATFALARISPRAVRKALLEGLAERTAGRELRQVRGALLRSQPSLAALWRWLRALSNGDCKASVGQIRRHRP